MQRVVDELIQGYARTGHPFSYEFIKWWLEKAEPHVVPGLRGCGITNRNRLVTIVLDPGTDPAAVAPRAKWVVDQLQNEWTTLTFHPPSEVLSWYLWQRIMGYGPVNGSDRGGDTALHVGPDDEWGIC